MVKINMKCLNSDHKCIDEMYERNTNEIMSNVIIWIEKLSVIIYINFHAILSYLFNGFITNVLTIITIGGLIYIPFMIL
jgi:hypothetical protein